MNRDDFSSRTKRTLGESVGFNCVRPGCAKPTTALDTSNGHITNIGNAAHDSAASPGGPRFEETLTSEQRKALDNGAWLCCNCARLVDIEPERFPLGTLKKWQEEAIENRRMLRDLPQQPAHFSLPEAAVNIKNFLKLCDKINILPNKSCINGETISGMKGLIRKCSHLSVNNEYSALFPHLVNKQIQMVDNINFIFTEIIYSGRWYYNLDTGSHIIKPHQHHNANCIEHKTKRSLILVKNLLHDFYEFKKELNDILTKADVTKNLYTW